jgi:murein DD-endopeptidase MepM/ murein hydrolase activator NlpD
MKSIWRILIAILLSLLLAGAVWQEVHAPQYEADIAPDREQDIIVVSSDAPRPTGSNQLLKPNTTIPRELATLPDKEMATVTPIAKPASCSDGAVGSGVFVWPADNHFLTGNDYTPDHPGIDIAAGEGSPVYAADAGVVVAKGDDETGYGNVIEIDHHNGYLTIYAHMSVIGVSMCQSVESGQWIGAAGSTGNARGAHLHFAIALDGRAINPWTVLP